MAAEPRLQYSTIVKDLHDSHAVLDLDEFILSENITIPGVELQPHADGQDKPIESTATANLQDDLEWFKSQQPANHEQAQGRARRIVHAFLMHTESDAMSGYASLLDESDNKLATAENALQSLVQHIKSSDQCL